MYEGKFPHKRYKLTLDFLKNHKIIKVNSNSYNYNSDKYKLSMFAKCDYFIHAAGITEEEIANHGSNKSLKRANIASTRLLNHIVNLGCKNITSSFHSRLLDRNIKSTTIFLFSKLDAWVASYMHHRNARYSRRGETFFKEEPRRDSRSWR
mgnify:CR=1 FL=1